MRGLRSILGAALVLLAVTGVATAQHALDRNLRVGGGRVNPSKPRTGVVKPLYTVNRQTGALQYNRANAFNDPAYNIYNRYAVSRNQYFYAGHTAPPKPAAPRGPVIPRSPGRTTPMAHRSRAPSSLIQSPEYKIDSGASLARPSVLRQPTYRIDSKVSSPSGRSSRLSAPEGLGIAEYPVEDGIHIGLVSILSGGLAHLASRRRKIVG